MCFEPWKERAKELTLLGDERPPNLFIDIVELMPEMPVPSAMEAISSDKQVSPRPERPNSSQGRKRPAPSLQRELTALASDEGVQGVTEKKRRTAAITSELRQQQGKTVENKTG